MVLPALRGGRDFVSDAQATEHYDRNTFSGAHISSAGQSGPDGSATKIYEDRAGRKDKKKGVTMKIEADLEVIKLVFDSVRHTRLDIEDFLENGALSDLEPDHKNEIKFYRELRERHDRLADLENELIKIMNHGNIEETSAADQPGSETLCRLA